MKKRKRKMSTWEKMNVPGDLDGLSDIDNIIVIAGQIVLTLLVVKIAFWS